MTDQKAESLKPEVTVSNTLQNLVANLGTSKDKRSHSFFLAKGFTHTALDEMYTGDWLAAKIVDIPPDDMTRNWRKVTTPSMDPRQVEVFEKQEKELGVKAKFNEALKWASLYGGAVIFLGVEDTGNVTEPLDLNRVKQGSLKFIHVLDRYMIQAGKLNMDPTKANYQMPEFYQTNGGDKRIHHTRLIRFDGLKSPYRVRKNNNYWSASVLQRVWDAILNSQSFAEIVCSLGYEAKVDIISIKNLMQELSRPGGEQSIIDRFHLADVLKSINNTLLLDMDEKHERKQINFSGMKDLIAQYLSIAAGAADIPETRLMGSSPGGLNATGESDLENYYNMIGARQENQVEPQLAYLDEVLVRSVFGGTIDDWQFEFNSLWQLSDKSKAEIQKMNAERDAIYIDKQVVTPSIAAEGLRENNVYTGVDDNYLEALAEVEGLIAEESVE